MKTNTIRDAGGKVFTKSKHKSNRWKEYMENLYPGIENVNLIESENEVEDEETGDSILWSEFEEVLKGLKKNIAPGVNFIPAVLLQKSGKDVWNRIYKLICETYEYGKIPSDFKRNWIVPISKKAGIDKCENYRSIALKLPA